MKLIQSHRAGAWQGLEQELMGTVALWSGGEVLGRGLHYHDETQIATLALHLTCFHPRTDPGSPYEFDSMNSSFSQAIKGLKSTFGGKMLLADPLSSLL